MDHLQYNYSGKIWRPCPTAGSGDCFFHSVFGTNDGNDQIYCDKYAKFHRVYWLAFLTYYSFGNVTGALLELLKKCLIANKQRCVENPDDLIDYANEVTSSGYSVRVEEIPLLATLGNLRIVLFIDNLNEPKIFEPNSEFLGNFPLRNISNVQEVVICLVNHRFSRLNPYDEPASNEANTLIDKLTFVQEQDKNEKKPKDTLSFNRKKYYEKLGSAGIKGSLYQINLLTMFLLNGMRKVENWRLSTEDKKAAKLDDLIFEYLPSESTILLQAKHKEDETKKVTYKDLTSPNHKNEFSLPKYFFSYLEVKSKFKVQNVVICTNLGFDEETKSILNEESVSPDSVLHFEGTENIFYSFHGCSFPQLKKNIKRYYAQYIRNKKVIISDEHINDFLKHLQFFPNCLRKETFDQTIEQTITRVKFSVNLSSKMIQKDIHKKMMDWFQEKKGRYLTEVEAKAFFCDIRSNKYCDNLKLYDISFKKNNLPIILQTQQMKGKNGNKSQQKNNNDTPVTDPKRISHIIPEKEYILNVVKIYQALQTDKTAKALFVNPNETIEIQKQIIDAFEVQHYSILVIVCPNTIEETMAKEMCDKVMETMNTYKYKHVILIAEERNILATQFKNANSNFYEVIIDKITFADLEESTQEALKRKKLINFQGSIMNLENIFTPSTNEVLNQMVNSEILIKLAVNDQIVVGHKLQHLDNYYIYRSFNRNGHNIPEENICCSGEISEEKVILISDLAGMGKSTVLTSLAIALKRNNPHLWIVRFDLNNYTQIMKKTLKQGGNSISITELLDSKEVSKLRSEFERKLFATRERVVLMLDGVDEVSPRYTELIKNLLKDSLTQVNLAKIFVTSRPHLCNDLEKLLNLQSITLEPFSESNQTIFLQKYWTEQLNLQSGIRWKCESYAKALVQILSKWVNDKPGNRFAGIPLQTRMLAEVFQENRQVSDVEHKDWEGCKEFSSSDNDVPKLPRKINLIQLYKMFINKKRDIFIDEKSNPVGNTAVDEALEGKFEKCHEFHRALALQVIFESDEWGLFTCYTNMEWPISSAFANNFLLRAGIVQLREEKMYFIHRTFAEYFVAQSLIIELKGESMNEAFQKFLMDNILRETEFYVIRAFFDSFIQEELPSLEHKISRYFCINYMISRSESFYLHLFAGEGCAGILDFIIKCTNFNTTGDRNAPCKSINVKDLGNTPLHKAAYWGHLNVTKCLVRMGAAVDMKNDASDTAITVAAEKGHLGVVKFLIGVADDVIVKAIRCSSALQKSALKGHMNVVKFLVLEAGTDVNQRDKFGKTALYYAATSGNLAIVKFLVDEGGADVNAADITGGTPLHKSAMYNRLEVVKFLVNKAGADVNSKDQLDITPLHEAIYGGNLGVVKLLVNEGGVSVNLKHECGRTALIAAASVGNLDIVKFLVDEADADVNIKDDDEWTALRVASFKDQLEVVKFLTDKTNPKNITDKK